MTRWNAATLVYLWAAALAASAAFAQQAPATAQPPAATAPTALAAQDADDTAALIAQANAAAAANAKSAQAAAAPKPRGPVEPTGDAKKKAAQYGFHAEVFDGKTMFCKDDATLGTRLPSKKCMDAMQFEDYAVQLEYARDTMRANKGCNGQGLCGGVQ